MEWQANALAPRILMPAVTTRQKIEELIDKNKSIYDEENIIDLLEAVIYELADFFQVSKEAAKIRMLDLGYQQVEGIYMFVDDHYILSYFFEEGALRRGQSFTINPENAIIEYAVNPKLRELIDSDKYVYVDTHYCINDSKYVQFDNSGTLALTDYARQHMDECCLIFDIKRIKRKDYGAAYYKECVLFREAISKYNYHIKYTDSDRNKAVEERAKKLAAVSIQNKELLKIKLRLTPTFYGSLTYLMECFGFTNESLAKECLISEKMISRLRSNEDHNKTIQTVIALCIGMSLPPILSEYLIERAGHKFKCTEEHITLQNIVTTMYPESIYTCNEVLRSMGFKSLSKEC